MSAARHGLSAVELRLAQTRALDGLARLRGEAPSDDGELRQMLDDAEAEIIAAVPPHPNGSARPLPDSETIA